MKDATQNIINVHEQLIPGITVSYNFCCACTPVLKKIRKFHARRPEIWNRIVLPERSMGIAYELFRLDNAVATELTRANAYHCSRKELVLRLIMHTLYC